MLHAQHGPEHASESAVHALSVPDTAAVSMQSRARDLALAKRATLLLIRVTAEAAENVLRARQLINPFATLRTCCVVLYHGVRAAARRLWPSHRFLLHDRQPRTSAHQRRTHGKAPLGCVFYGPCDTVFASSGCTPITITSDGRVACTPTRRKAGHGQRAAYHSSHGRVFVLLSPFPLEFFHAEENVL